MLSNYEVLTLLKDLQSQSDGKRKGTKMHQNLATVSYETMKYLEKTPCKEQTPEIIKNFLLALEPYKLTKAEKLQLLNQRPTSAVEIQLMIEESEERLTEDQIEELLQLISTHLLIEETEEMDAQAGDGQ
ncbi:DNA-directed RNA polymerase III subunit RPC9-like isoform X2 [Anneissia japonica]|nr:DNA-directed RNA polymerase III subunit RPC9-like isoform X2 [Anneissia japonica]